MIGVHQHVDGKHQSQRGSAAVRINQDVGDRDRTSRRQRDERLFEQGSASLFAFAVQDVAGRRNRVAATEIGVEQIAFNKR